jgi:predicted transposase/invertase (TIGR01784 family)
MALSKFLDPKNDIAFKRVFGSEEHKDILIHFINDILEFKDNDQIESIEYLSPIQDSELISKKQSIVDVLCRDKNGVQIIVEMQVAPNEGFEKRAQYYAAKAYSRQLNKGSENRYAQLKKVIFIAITNYRVFPDKLEYKSDHIVLDKKTFEHDLQDFSFTFIELPKFKKTKIEELNGILEKWCYYFKYADETSEQDLKDIIGSDLVIERAYEVLNQFNWSEQELLSYEAEIKRVRDNIATLDYQLNRAEERGVKKGIEQIAINMLKENIDINTITLVTGLTSDDILKLKNKL